MSGFQAPEYRSQMIHDGPCGIRSASRPQNATANFVGPVGSCLIKHSIASLMSLFEPRNMGVALCSLTADFGKRGPDTRRARGVLMMDLSVAGKVSHAKGKVHGCVNGMASLRCWMLGRGGFGARSANKPSRRPLQQMRERASEMSLERMQIEYLQ